MRFPHPHTASFVALLLFAAVITPRLYAAEVPAKGKPALPGERCQTEPRENWKPQEKWVWNQVCEGKIANFNEGERYGGKLDPKKAEGWTESRVLTPAFLKTILLDEPYRSAVPYPGVRIEGARFKEAVDLSRAPLDHELWLHVSRFESTLNLELAKAAHLLSFEGSWFGGKLDMGYLEVDSSLSMLKAEFANEVDLLGAKVGRTLGMIDSTFKGEVNMNGLQVGGPFFMSKARFEKKVDLGVAKVGANLNMAGSTFKGVLNMNSLRVGGHLFMRRGGEFTEVNLGAGRIRGHLQMQGSKFRRKLDMDSLQVGGSLLMRGVAEWPEEMELDGFTYTRLVGDMATQDIPWFKEWLGRQKTYSPQPYEQLASVLRKMGHEAKAKEILYARRERERTEVAKGTSWLWLFLKWIFIGYGYRIYYAVFWTIGFIAIGALVFRSTEEARRYDMPYGIAYSLDMLLPIIRLRERHYVIDLAGWSRYYFYLHKVMGYVLASFLIAGLSGLAK